MNSPTVINQARILVLAQGAIQAIEALMREVGKGEEPTEQPERRQLRRVPERREEQDELPPHCPDCGGPMVQRKSVRGPFFGCKQYPHCKGTRPGAGQSNPIKQRMVETAMRNDSGSFYRGAMTVEP